jgi:hypothetical protein
MRLPVAGSDALDTVMLQKSRWAACAGVPIKHVMPSAACFVLDQTLRSDTVNLATCEGRTLVMISSAPAAARTREAPRWMFRPRGSERVFRAPRRSPSRRVTGGEVRRVRDVHASEEHPAELR